MAKNALLTYDANQDAWLEGCGCGGKKRIPHPLMANTTPTFISHDGFLKGPVTGNDYFIVPNTTSLNIDTRDVEAWALAKIAKPVVIGFKGHETRTA